MPDDRLITFNFDVEPVSCAPTALAARGLLDRAHFTKFARARRAFDGGDGVESETRQSGTRRAVSGDGGAEGVAVRAFEGQGAGHPAPADPSRRFRPLA